MASISRILHTLLMVLSTGFCSVFAQASLKVNPPLQFHADYINTSSGLFRNEISAMAISEQETILLSQIERLFYVKGSYVAPLNVPTNLGTIIEIKNIPNTEDFILQNFESELFHASPTEIKLIGHGKFFYPLGKNQLLFLTEDGNAELWTKESEEYQLKEAFNLGLSKITELVCNETYCLISTSSNVSIFNVQTKSIQPLDLISNHLKNSTWSESRGFFWATYQQSLLTIALNGTINRIQLPAEIHNSIIGIIESTEDELYVFSNDYIAVWKSSEKWTLYESKYLNIRKNTVKRITRAKDFEHIYIATGSQGLIKLRKKEATTFYEGTAFEKTSLGSIVPFDEASILVNTGFSLQKATLKDHQITEFFKNPIPNTSFASVSMVHKGYAIGLWNAGVIILLKDKSYTYHKLPDGYNGVFSIHQDKVGNYWIATQHGILLTKNFSDFEIIIQGNSFVTNTSIDDSRLFFGGKNGFIIVNTNNKSIESNGIDPFLFKNTFVRSLLKTEEGYLLGTTGEGLMLLPDFGEPVIILNQLPGANLPLEAFTLIRSKGMIFMTSNRGVRSICEAQLYSFLRKEKPYLTYLEYQEASGILNTEFNGGFQNNYLQLQDGSFYAPTIQGLVYFQPRSVTLPPPAVIVREFVIDGKSYELLPRIVDRSTGGIEIKLQITHDSEIRNSQIQYKLETNGIANEWSTIPKTNNIYIPINAAGAYKLSFRVWDGLNEAYISQDYSFSIPFKLYEKRWFQVLSLLVIIGITLLGGYRIHQRKSYKKQLIMESKNKIQDLELKLWQSKMNPHFLFNTLNSISSKIALGNTSKAEELIQSFSQLLREFTEKSDRLVLSVEEDIEIVIKYLSLQKNRFEDELDFFIDIEKTTLKSIVPAFIIQPLVENAIIHGIRHLKDRKGIIELSIKRSEGGLVIKIKDNGIGIEESKKINIRTHAKKSTGLDLINRKIDIVKEIHGIQTTMDMIRSDAQGTEIIITVNYA